MQTLLMASPPGQGQASIVMQMLPLVGVFVIFYFVLIRPAGRRQRELQHLLDSLKPGDRVVTSGGIIGTVVGVDRSVVQLRVADKVKIDVTKSSVVSLQAPDETVHVES
jgi:preprotein translocase subunit YajC